MKITLTKEQWQLLYWFLVKCEKFFQPQKEIKDLISEIAKQILEER